MSRVIWRPASRSTPQTTAGPCGPPTGGRSTSAPTGPVPTGSTRSPGTPPGTSGSCRCRLSTWDQGRLPRRSPPRLRRHWNSRHPVGRLHGHPGRRAAALAHRGHPDARMGAVHIPGWEVGRVHVLRIGPARGVRRVLPRPGGKVAGVHQRRLGSAVERERAGDLLPDGRGALMSAAVTSAPSFHVATPTRLFDVDPPGRFPAPQLRRDGGRAAIPGQGTCRDQRAPVMSVTLNWTAALGRK